MDKRAVGLVSLIISFVVHVLVSGVHAPGRFLEFCEYMSYAGIIFGAFWFIASFEGSAGDKKWVKVPRNKGDGIDRSLSLIHI